MTCKRIVENINQYEVLKMSFVKGKGT